MKITKDPLKTFLLKETWISGVLSNNKTHKNINSKLPQKIISTLISADSIKISFRQILKTITKMIWIPNARSLTLMEKTLVLTKISTGLVRIIIIKIIMSFRIEMLKEG